MGLVLVVILVYLLSIISSCFYTYTDDEVGGARDIGVTLGCTRSLCSLDVSHLLVVFRRAR